MVPLVVLVEVTQLKGMLDVAVQLPAAARLIVLSVLISFSSWRVGLMCN